MIRTPALLGALAVCGLSTATPADEIRLTDGRVLIGTVRSVGDEVRIRTRSGETVTVTAAEVLRIRSDDELREELRQLASGRSGAPHAEVELARLAWRYGLAAEAWAHADACLAAAPDAAIRDRLDRLLADLGEDLVPAHRLRADAETKVRALLAKLRTGSTPAQAAAVEALLARAQDEGVDEQLRRRARSSSTALQRQTALRTLLRRDPAHESFVWRSAVVDGDPEVRLAAMGMAKDAGRSEAAVDYLSAGLVQPDGRIRIRTAEAFAALGDRAAIQPLVAAGPLAGTASLSPGATRAHVAFINQQAYVRDFDVEVAMSSFIGDPKIGVVQSGVVLDVTVAAVTRMRTQIVGAYRRALVTLAGEDPGPDPDAWLGWLEARPEFPELAAKLDAAIAKAKAAPRGGGAGGGGAPGPAGPGPGPRGGGGGARGGGGEGGGIGIPIMPGSLPPLPGTTFPPAPPPPSVPTPAGRHGPGR
jgi:hypothetical protein